MNIMKYILFIVITGISCSSYAYETRTHAKLSEEGIRKSILWNSMLSPLNNYGLHQELPIGVDEVISGSYIPIIMNSAGQEGDILSIAINGAISEDDDKRPLNHFYDPEHDRALDKPVINNIFTIYSSPDWALEDNSVIEEQNYSYLDAVNYFYLALTGGTKSGRDNYWSKTFESIGRIIHHIQDMAQPEHVRNDDHCNTQFCSGIENISGWDIHDPSYYERYSGELINIDEQLPSNISLTYPIPVFTNARKYWVDIDDTGISDFTNQNFVSKDSNFVFNNGSLDSNDEYPLPVPTIVRTETLTSLLNDGGTLCQELLAKTPVPILPENVDCVIDFIASDINDNQNQAANGENPYSSSLSLYHDFLSKYNVGTISIRPNGVRIVEIGGVTSLNSFNYDAAHEYLIPRAVAYSAGFINHFFRAEVDFYKNPTGPGWVLKNNSSTQINGSAEIFLDEADEAGTRSKLSLDASTNLLLSSIALNAGQELILPDYNDVFPEKSKIVVFKGNTVTVDGNDIAVAAKYVHKQPIRVFWTREEYYTESLHSSCFNDFGDLYKPGGTAEWVDVSWFIAVQDNAITNIWTWLDRKLVDITQIILREPCIDIRFTGGGSHTRDIVEGSHDTSVLTPPAFDVENLEKNAQWSEITNMFESAPSMNGNDPKWYLYETPNAFEFKYYNAVGTRVACPYDFYHGLLLHYAGSALIATSVPDPDCISGCTKFDILNFNSTGSGSEQISISGGEGYCTTRSWSPARYFIN
jgi:hypothetical protein